MAFAEDAPARVLDVEVAAAEADIARAVSETEITRHRAGPAAGAEDEEAEKFRDMFGARLIRPNHLNFPLRLLMWLAIAQVVLVAILMALQRMGQPQVNSSVLDPAGGTSQYRWRCLSS